MGGYILKHYKEIVAKILPRAGIPKKDVLALVSAHSQNSAEVADILGPLFDEANRNDELLTFKEVTYGSKSFSSGSGYAYIHGIRFKPVYLMCEENSPSIESREASSASEFQSLFNKMNWKKMRFMIGWKVT